MCGLTTLTSCEMETSNSTVTGSDTFSTGLMNWLYLLNSFLKSRSSALDEEQSARNGDNGGSKTNTFVPIFNEVKMEFKAADFRQKDVFHSGKNLPLVRSPKAFILIPLLLSWQLEGS